MDGLFSVSTPSPPSYGMGGGGFGKKGMSNSQPLSKAAEAVIKRSLLVGNFEAAVQCCMSTGNMADALLLARYSLHLCMCVCMYCYMFVALYICLYRDVQ